MKAIRSIALAGALAGALVLLVGSMLPVRRARAAGEERARKEPPAFAAEPRVEKRGRAYVITFAVKGECDATVAIVGPEGRVVRHLASGVLGANAPEPFQRNALAQRIEWDGLDDAGRPAPRPCKVSLRLGLEARFERFLRTVPQGVATRGPVGAACDAEGALYVAEGALHVARNTTLVNLKVFARDGDYLRTVIPFRADWPAEKISAVDLLRTPDGRRIPLSGAHSHRPFSGFLPGMPGMRRHTPLVTKDGRYIYVCGDAVTDPKGRKARRLLAVGTDGSADRKLFYGPPLPEDASAGTDTFLALSPDEKTIYIGGTKRGKRFHHAVYRVRWGDAEPPRPFLGVEFEPGDDNKHFNQPRGLATDPDGRIYVGDYMNDRVQVFKADGTYLKTFPVAGPEQILIHPKTRAVYVLSVRDRGETARYAEVRWEIFGDKSVIKFRSLEDWTEVARIDLPKRQRHMHDSGPILCLDASAEKPGLWCANVGRQEAGDFLWKIVDEGKHLKRVEHKVVRYDRRQSVLAPHMAAARGLNAFYMIGGGLKGVFRCDAETGKMEPVPILGAGKLRVGDAAVGPEDRLYLSCGEVFTDEKVLDRNGRPRRQMRWHIRRYTPEGVLVPFKAGRAIVTLGHHGGTYAGEKCGPFAVAPDGKVYVVEWTKLNGPRCRLSVYGPDGAPLKKGLIADMTKTAGDVAVDGQGRLCVADAVKPRFPGAQRSREFPPFMGSDPRLHFKLWYGTVCRFDTEKGGSFRHLEKSERENETHLGYSNASVRLEGAKWRYYGVSPMTQGAHCECVVARMDADGWGRIFVPDVPGYSVQVLDPAGNFVTRFGEYGNPDAGGPGSAVPKPEIPLWFPQAVVALDSHVAIVDSHNRRVVEVKLGYRAETLVPVP